MPLSCRSSAGVVQAMANIAAGGVFLTSNCAYFSVQPGTP